MPCRTYDDDAYMIGEKQQKKMDQLTAMLCEAMTVLEKYDATKRVSKTTRIWWKRHKAADAKRQAEEKERKLLKKLAARARGKLTVAEIEALRAEGL